MLNVDRQQSGATGLDLRAREVGPGVTGTIAVFVGAFIAFFLISRYMLVAPDTVVTLRNNVLFETDSGVRLRYLTDPGTWAASRLEFVEHPAFFLVWRPIGLALTFVFGLFAPAAAPVLAVQTLICGAAAAGAAALFRMAGRWGSAIPLALAPLALLVLATATVLVVVPEHWAMAQGMMLSACYVLTMPGRPGRGRVAVLAALCALIAATTITNIVFGLLLVLFLFVLRPRADGGGIRLPGPKVMTGLVAAGVVPILVAGWIAVRLPHVAGFLNLRLVLEPFKALAYMAFGLVGPIVGPVPYEFTERAHLVLSYEPVSFGMYSPVQWIGVSAWIALLALCGWHAVRDRESRWVAGFLIAWIGFNLIFHNLWGDEFFLYSAHWAWALIAVVVLGLRHVRARLAVPLVAAVAIGQIVTLTTIGRMLRESPQAGPAGSVDAVSSPATSVRATAGADSGSAAGTHVLEVAR